MTAPDSLEKILEDMRVQAHKWWGGSQRERALEFAARIEALIPSKAEREFLEAALSHFEAVSIMKRGWSGSLAVENRVLDTGTSSLAAYRALLAERGKK